MPTCRTMFSRTTMASSIRRPMHRLKRHHRHEVQREAEGIHGDEAADHRDRQRQAVMMVLRQLCRNRKTMATVSSAPSTSVCFRPSSEPLTPVAAGVDQAQLHVGRQRLAHCRPSPSSPRRRRLTMLASCCLKTLKTMARWPLMRASESGSFSRSTSCPRSAKCQRQAAAARHHQLLELLRVAHAAFHAQQSVLHGCRSAGPPAGRRWLPSARWQSRPA